jgi:hypothetical protein
MARACKSQAWTRRRLCRRLPGNRVSGAPSYILLLLVVLLVFASLPVAALSGQASQDSQLDAPVQTAGHAEEAASAVAWRASQQNVTITDRSQWSVSMSNSPVRLSGCFVATYPSTVWQVTQCVTAPLLPLLPSTVGNGNDYVAQSSSTLIGSSKGSFQVSGLTSETDSIFGANNYGLQVNSQFFTTSTTYTGGKSTTGWEQFVWINYPYYNSVGYGYIQYWLLYYQSSYGSCPSTGPPGGSSWMAYSGHCYANSAGFVTPLEAPTNLASLSLNGFSHYNGAVNDVNMFCISGGSCYSISITDQIVNLYEHWQYSEFNVFGVGEGSQANFNSGTSITVTNTLKDQSGNVIVPSCVNTGYTGETNNLNLVSCSSNSNGQIVFNENYGSTLNIVLVSPPSPPNGGTAFSSPVTFQVQVTNFAGAPVQGAGVTIYVNHPYLYITYFCASSSDSNGYFSCDITLTDSGTGYRWYATASKTGYVPATSQTWTFNYFAQLTMTVSYSVAGGGAGYSDPIFNYVHGGQSNTYILTATSTGISVDSGSAWSVTPNPLTGSTPSERWYSSQTLSGTASTTTIVFTFYHQYLQTLSYAVSGGGSGYSAPIFTANRYGVSAAQTLTSTATGYWYDAGSPWSATPNPLSGSGTSECWISAQTTSGTLSSAQAIVFAYQHQYYLTTQVNPSSGGTVSVSSGWQSAGTAVPIAATPNTDYSFYYWSLDGTNVGTNPSYSALMNSAHTLTAMFRGTSSISVSMSVAPDGFAWIVSGTITPTQPSPGIPAGTPVMLSCSSDGGGTWSSFVTVLTSSGGDYSVYWQQPYQYTDFRVRASWNGNTAHEGSTSSYQLMSGTYGPFYPPVSVSVSGSSSVARGGLATFDVRVTCPASYTLDRTLYVVVVGPNGYQYFDTVTVSVAAGESESYQFVWQASSSLTTGTYQVYVGLIPPNPAAIGQTQITVT